MSQASSSKICKYDVFLSFRGEDTRRNIVSHLYNALQQRGIRTFKDDERLKTGKSISDELLKAIEETRFAVVIFSKSYASSRWCLEELAHIIKCKNELEQIVIPVFYDVSPSDVRHQNPPFADSFSQHEEKYKDDTEKVQRWRDAFVEAGKLSGYHLPNFKDEAECIKKLVDDIFPKSLQIISPLPEMLVGMKSQVEKVTSLLDMESSVVRSIGIWGMGGIGKTEIANVLHQRYRHQFEADCFLGDVRKLQKNGLTYLQEVVIYKLVGERMTITSEYEGMNILKNMLYRKKVLLILDDVSHREQLESLFGGPEWFGMGSRIVLTARDKNLVISHVGENVYEVQLLSEDEALELFSRHAFKEKSPKEDFVELSIQVVKHAGGLPLALKVLGSSFYGRDKKHWRHMIDRLKRIPHKDVLGKLRLSFDDLDEDEKEVFLDIAFMNIVGFGKGSFSLYRDGSHGFLIDSLIEKSLLSISIGNRIVMHNMISRMGEKVIREEYTSSRIWLPEEVCDLFKGKLTTEKVESLCIPKEYIFEDDQLVNYSNIFKKMQSLKILKVQRKDIPAKEVGSLLSHIITKGFGLLRVLDLEGVYKPSLPENLGDLFLLRYLGLRWTFLDALPSSVGDLPYLETLDVKHTNINNLPTSMWKLKHLRHLNLSHIHLDMPKHSDCGSLPELLTLWGLSVDDESRVKNGLDQLHNLREAGITFCLSNCEDLLNWISGLNSLQSLRLRSKNDIGHPSHFGDKPLSLSSLSNLSQLNLLGELPKLPENLPKGLKVVTLSLSKLTEDPMPILGKLRQLNVLRLLSNSYMGKKLVCPQGGFEELRVLKLWKLKNLEEWNVEGQAMGKLKEINIRCCYKLMSIPSDLRKQKSLKELVITNMPKEFIQYVNQFMRNQQVILTCKNYDFTPLQWEHADHTCDRFRSMASHTNE